MSAPLQTRTLGSATDKTSSPTRMIIRLWVRPKQIPRPLASGQNNHIQLQHLVENLVRSREGILQSSNEEFLSCAFDYASTALSAAKQLQWAIQGYHMHRSAPATAAAIALGSEPSGTGKLAEPEYHGRSDLESLLDLAKPSQVLITHSTYQSLQEFPGMEFRSFSERAGVYEYLWTDAEKLAEFQQAPEFSVPIVQPVVIPEIADHENGLPTPVLPPHQPIQTDLLARVSIALAQAVATASSLLSSGARRVQHALSSRWVRITAASAIVALLIATVIFFTHRFGAPSQLPATGAASQPAASRLRPPPKTTSSAQATGAQTTLNRDTNAVATSNEASPPAKTVAKPPVTSVEPKANCTIAGQVSVYLNMAERNRANGKYKDAERQFREILNCEPNNEQAREGLNKAVRAGQERSGPAGP